MAVKLGRPRKKPKIPPRKISQLAAMGCTIEEIAVLCELSRDTIERRFAAKIAKGKGDGKERLRRLQWKSANKGNVVMQIWLGKQYLGQRDKHDIESSGPGGGAIPVANLSAEDLTDDQLAAIIAGEKR